MFKILLLGTNRAVIDDFFEQLSDSFEILSCSLRYVDVKAHLKYVNPDAVVYCLKNESRENMNRTVIIKNDMHENIPFFIIGNEEDCHEFNHCAVNVADYTLYKPINAQKIKFNITNVLENRSTISQTVKKDISKTPATESNSPFSLSDDDLTSLLESIDMLANNLGNPRKHILIVDDDVQMQKTIKHHLEENYDIATAISGKIALRFIQKKHTDLILLDYEMPEMNGSEVLEQIRSNPETKNIPVIFLTGIAEREKIEKALSLNPQGYILKPTDKNTLLTKIATVLN